MIEFPKALETAFERVRNQYGLRMVEGNSHLIERSLIWNDGRLQKHLTFDPYEGVSVYFTEVTPAGRFIIKVPHIVWKGSWPTIVLTDFNERLAIEKLPADETTEFYTKKIEGYLTRFGKKS